MEVEFKNCSTKFLILEEWPWTGSTFVGGKSKLQKIKSHVQSVDLWLPTIFLLVTSLYFWKNTESYTVL